MKIIKYNNYSDIDIEFENGYVSKNNTYQNFKKDKYETILLNMYLVLRVLVKENIFQKKMIL